MDDIMNITGMIFDIKRFAIHDGPGIRTTIFLKGCPLHCEWCHNPESISSQQQIMFTPEKCIGCRACEKVCKAVAHVFDGGMHIYVRDRCAVCGRCAEVCYAQAIEVAGRKITVADAIAELEKDRPFYETSNGGITLSGGEPMMQLEFTAALLETARKRGLHTCLDTSGYAAWNSFERVLPYVNIFLYDLKFIDDEKHRRYTGVSNRLILENLRRLVGLDADVKLRCPIIPTINDTEEHFAQLAGFIKSLNRQIECEILPYHSLATSKYRRMGREYSLADLKIPKKEDSQRWASRLREMGIEVTIN